MSENWELTCCPLCKELINPSELGSEPRCAFVEGVFTSDNWQCGTALTLRLLAEQSDEWDGWVCRDDNDSASCGVLRIPECDEAQGYVVMSWYKDRGTTGQIWVFHDDKEPHSITLDEAMEVIEFVERGRELATNKGGA